MGNSRREKPGVGRVGFPFMVTSLLNLRPIIRTKLKYSPIVLQYMRSKGNTTTIYPSDNFVLDTPSPFQPSSLPQSKRICLRELMTGYIVDCDLPFSISDNEYTQSLLHLVDPQLAEQMSMGKTKMRTSLENISGKRYKGSRGASNRSYERSIYYN
jgi:hypothetical protein